MRLGNAEEIRKYQLFGIGGFELFIILLFAFLIFGPDKLPEMAKTLGVALSKFKQAQEEMKAVINDEVLDPDAGKKAASGSGSKPAPHATQESFAERKARYDKERAERLKRQQIDANRTAMKAEAAKKAEELEKAAEGKSEEAAEKAADHVKSVSKSMPSAKPAPALTPDELFGTKPMKPAPRAAQKEAAATKGGE